MTMLVKPKAERTVSKSQLTRNNNFLEQMTEAAEEAVNKAEVAARLQKLKELHRKPNIDK